MKNQSSSYLFNAYQTDTPGHLLVNDDPATALSQGLHYQVEDWVALELTAEQMLGDEVNLVSTYVAEDSRQFWDAVKETLLPYELAAGQILLRAADPTQVEWLHNHWWEHQEPALH
ncbi:MAG: hypothetical protein EOO53_01240 [Gammaproteobacteria bacterium]|nr:MAG: hypothetical protein EOO53_01240 [Gammaproteobacteria bacterium]